jgi:predicted O-linked N-acetylglucosamine transferase (SPINDLY family)
VLNLLGILHFQSGRQDTGFIYLQQAVSLQPDFVGAHFNLARAFRLTRQFDTAVLFYKKTVELKTDHVAALNDLGNTYKEMGKLTEALECFQRILEITSDFAEAYGNMALVLLLQGELDKAETSYRKCLQLKPDAVTQHSNLLLSMQYNPAHSDEQIFAEHCRWDMIHGSQRRNNPQLWENTPCCDRIINVGYVSPDFGRHPVGYFLESILASHDRGKVKVFCYSDRSVNEEDDLTLQIRAKANVWRSIENMPDEKVLDIIKSDGIDILVDLAGHTRKNRLTLFAMKAAPIQATWAGYVGTTGLAAMDYLISDERQSPLGAEALTVESIVRLPDCYVCYSPPEYAPEVAPLPALRNGYVTFGSFNNLSKITPHVVTFWARLLTMIPDSRLLLRTNALGDQSVKNRYLHYFSQAGINGERILLEPALPHSELLAEYNLIDIALDPFPYSGGLTTLEALWMGVPVITLGGSRFCSRHSVSHLTAVGLEDMVTNSQDGYINVARMLAKNIDTLSEIRRTLRSTMEHSPLRDTSLFTRNLEVAFKKMWYQWCRIQSG